MSKQIIETKKINPKRKYTQKTKNYIARQQLTSTGNNEEISLYIKFGKIQIGVEALSQTQIPNIPKQLSLTKSPGLDGMSFSFFQKFWHIVRSDVTTAILSILNSGCLLQKMNYTHIVLVPKINDPQHVGEFRTINLGNVVSHIFSMVLANRLKMILSRVISDAQSAFVPDRLINDNTTVAFEILHKIRIRRRGKDG